MKRFNLVFQAILPQVVMAAVLGAFAPALSQPTPTVRPPAPAGRPPAVVPTTPSTVPASRPTASSTTFLCGQSGNNPATLVQVSGRTLQSPLIVWKTNYFGSDYTPEQRCQAVSIRLSNAVVQNGGRLSNLRLASGTVNNQTVICYTNGYGSCNANNMLFTLKPENATNPQAILASLMNFAQRGSGGAVYESGGIDSGEDTSISLEEAVDRAIQAESGGLTVPSAQESVQQPAQQSVQPETAPSYSPNLTTEPTYTAPNVVYPASPEAGAYPGGI